MDHHLTRKRSNQRAFTIIELLVVIGIIAILSGIFFGVAGGVRERSKISRAESDLILLSQYLEEYKAHYGDYPRVTLVESNSTATSTKVEGEDAGTELYNALNGMRGPQTGTASVFTAKQRSFIDRSKFNVAFAPSRNPPSPSDPETAPAVLLDPWGNAYRYYYPPPPATATPPPPAPAWRNPRFVLYSMGPGGEHERPTITTDGYPEKSDLKNVDNLYAK